MATRQARILAKETRRNSKKAFLERWEKLKMERSTWIAHWREISEYTLPRRIRLLTTGQKNRGEKMNQKIINSAPGRSLRILAAGLMSGMSSPARPWFRLTTPYPELMDVDPVRQWLHHVEEGIRNVFARSNIYNILPLTYRDLGAWGTAVQCIEEDDIDVIRGYSYPVGSYALQNSHRLTVDTVYHETSMTVGQIADKFGLENASPSLVQMWESNDHDATINLLHVIEPNEKYDSTQLGPVGKKYRSVWLERDSANEDGKPLGEGNGYREFPAQCPRWDVHGEDIYGESPAMEALGDIKALQQLEKRKLTALDKITNPPMVAPPTLERKKKSQLAGDVTYNELTTGGQKFEPAYIVDSRAFQLREEIAEHVKRIDQSFYVDLFLMLANAAQAQPITAREVDERHEEKMLQLGPVLERLHDELLTPLIDRTFEIMLDKGMFPPPPPELEGMELRVEFISILAQAQKLLGTIAVERLVGFVGSTVQVFPDAADKVDIDKVIDDYSKMLGTNPDLVRTGDALEQLRAQRAAQQQMAAMAAMAKPASDAANAAATMSQADVRQPGQLNGLMGALQP